LGWPTAVFDLACIALVVALAYFGLRRWLPRSSEFDIEPELSIARKHGWALLNLVLVNHSKTPIFAEEATFAIADLDADFQSTSAATEATLRIGENLRPGQTLRVSMIETVYKAAGKPQGEYSFLISGSVKYRDGNNRFEISLQTYRVRMIALSPIRLLRMRWYDPPPGQASTGSRLRRLAGDDKDWN
jgi:hypothetical protein